MGGWPGDLWAAAKKVTEYAHVAILAAFVLLTSSRDGSWLINAAWALLGGALMLWAVEVVVTASRIRVILRRDRDGIYRMARHVKVTREELYGEDDPHLRDPGHFEGHY